MRHDDTVAEDVDTTDRKRGVKSRSKWNEGGRKPDKEQYVKGEIHSFCE